MCNHCNIKSQCSPDFLAGYTGRSLRSVVSEIALSEMKVAPAGLFELFIAQIIESWLLQSEKIKGVLFRM